MGTALLQLVQELRPDLRCLLAQCRITGRENLTMPQ